jgi:hypothetical protein
LEGRDVEGKAYIVACGEWINAVLWDKDATAAHETMVEKRKVLTSLGVPDNAIALLFDLTLKAVAEKIGGQMMPDLLKKFGLDE